MIKFKIEKIDYLESELAFFKVINVVYWRVEIEENNKKLSTFGNLYLDLPKDNFIEFENVTNEILYDWVSKDLKYEKYLKKLKADFEILLKDNQKEIVPEFEQIIISE
jgi:hypothetical protein